MQLATAEFEGQPRRRVEVVDMKVQVQLLLWGPAWPLRRDMIRRELDTHDPFVVDDDAVPVVVATNLAAQ